MNVRAPKAPPMTGPIGSLDSDFPCTKTVASPLAGVAPDVGLDEEDSSVENDEEDWAIEYDENSEGDNTGVLGVVDGVVVAELRNEVVVRDDERSLTGRVSSLTIK